MLSCSDEGRDQSITEEFDKIETSYVDASSVRQLPGPKKETAAPEWYVAKVAQSMDAEIEKAMYQTSLGRSSGNIARTMADYDIGYIISPGTSCPGERIQFYFNNEDNINPAEVQPIALSGDTDFPITVQWGPGVDGDWWWEFCRVNGSGYQWNRYKPAHAVLKLGALTIPGAEEVVRYFDNQDNAQSYAYGNIYPNGLDRNNYNIALFFHNFSDSDTGSDFQPSNMGVLAAPNEAAGSAFHYFMDNEDNRNANWWRINNGGRIAELNYPYMGGGLNTSFYLLKFH